MKKLLIASMVISGVALIVLATTMGRKFYLEGRKCMEKEGNGKGANCSMKCTKGMQTDVLNIVSKADGITLGGKEKGRIEFTYVQEDQALYVKCNADVFTKPCSKGKKMYSLSAGTKVISYIRCVETDWLGLESGGFIPSDCVSIEKPKTFGKSDEVLIYANVQSMFL